MMDLAEIEVIKHRASWCNAVGNAVVTTGFLAPLAASILGVALSTGSLGFLFLTNGGALIIGVSLHNYGALFLNEIDA